MELGKVLASLIFIAQSAVHRVRESDLTYPKGFLLFCKCVLSATKLQMSRYTAVGYKEKVAAESPNFSRQVIFISRYNGKKNHSTSFLLENLMGGRRVSIGVVDGANHTCI